MPEHLKQIKIKDFKALNKLFSCLKIVKKNNYILSLAKPKLEKYNAKKLDREIKLL